MANEATNTNIPITNEKISKELSAGFIGISIFQTITLLGVIYLIINKD